MIGGVALVSGRSAYSVILWTFLISLHAVSAVAAESPRSSPKIEVRDPDGNFKYTLVDSAEVNWIIFLLDHARPVGAVPKADPMWRPFDFRVIKERKVTREFLFRGDEFRENGVRKRVGVQAADKFRAMLDLDDRQHALPESLPLGVDLSMELEGAKAGQLAIAPSDCPIIALHFVNHGTADARLRIHDVDPYHGRLPFPVACQVRFSGADDQPYEKWIGKSGWWSQLATWGTSFYDDAPGNYRQLRPGGQLTYEVALSEVLRVHSGPEPRGAPWDHRVGFMPGAHVFRFRYGDMVSPEWTLQVAEVPGAADALKPVPLQNEVESERLSVVARIEGFRAKGMASFDANERQVAFDELSMKVEEPEALKGRQIDLALTVGPRNARLGDERGRYVHLSVGRKGYDNYCRYGLFLFASEISSEASVLDEARSSQPVDVTSIKVEGQRSEATVSSVTVAGSVVNPGCYVLGKKLATLSAFLEKAGGLQSSGSDQIRVTFGGENGDSRFRQFRAAEIYAGNRDYVVPDGAGIFVVPCIGAGLGNLTPQAFAALQASRRRFWERVGAGQVTVTNLTP